MDFGLGQGREPGVTQWDFIVVGSGLTGSVIARTLSDAGRSVLVLERRNHVGGNVHEQTHESGIVFHTYGPHFFRTNSDRLWKFVNRFSGFRRLEASVRSYVDNDYENWPVAAGYIARTIGHDWRPGFLGTPQNFEEASLAMMPAAIYEKFVRGYTEKQWGVPARQLAASLAKRFDVRLDDEPRLTRHKYQGLPESGYAAFMRKMLDGIPTILNCDYLKHRGEFQARTSVVYTGPIDEYFGLDLGRLQYRGQIRRHEYLVDVARFQPCVQVNNPDPLNGPHIRTIEWKHMMPAESAKDIRGTLVTREVTITPTDPNDCEYPFPDDANARLYRRYAERAAEAPGVLICGRLGEYRYYDMDQAIARAETLARRLLQAPARRLEPPAETSPSTATGQG